VTWCQVVCTVVVWVREERTVKSVVLRGLVTGRPYRVTSCVTWCGGEWKRG
jgi:hypothetical protein